MPDEVARWDDEELWAQRDTVLCTCEAGQARRQRNERAMNNTAKFLTDIAAANAAARQRRQASREAEHKAQLTNSGVPPLFANACLADFDPGLAGDPGKTIGIAAARDLIANELVVVNGRPRNSLLLHSPLRGTGKTSLATAIYREWMLTAQSSIWLTYSQLLLAIRSGYDTKTAYQRIEEAQTAAVFLWDDLGDPKHDLTSHAVDITELVIYHRHAYGLRTLMTSNLTPAQLYRQFGQSTWERIGQMAAVIEFAGTILRPQ